ncbi:MAG: FixG Ig-like domain-containing protein [Pseudoxanthomonas suwonensis]|nr:FixG Ig-like domain-containing protein [Pseudoxanthomonas suwonensis]
MSKKIPLDVIDDGGSALYVSERKIYPRDVSGRFDRLRKAAVFWLLGMFYLFPWINWQGRQLVLFDLPARQFHVFGVTFWPQDFFLLALLLMMAGMSLFFFTTLAGRLWCGFACPQTVWTETFLWMERWTEGDRMKRMKLDAGPWTREKVLRKGSKHLLWLVFALWTGFTFVGYFTPIRDLGLRLFSLQWGGWETFWVLFYALATWGNAGFLREQVCKYMCPYARFQSAMFDRNTLLIAYDPMRGEPRGPRKRGLASVLERARGLLPQDTALDYVFRASEHPSAADARAQARGTITFADANTVAEPLPKFATEELGDCIDCTMCVQVCPTGIDIRNGLQYECIACGACIDACDEIMDKMGYPRGLIRFDTQNAIDGKPSKVLRPRVFIYGGLLLTLMLAFISGVVGRSPLVAEVIRDRNALYQIDGGVIENGYTIKLINKTGEPQQYRILVPGNDKGLRLRSGPILVNVEPGEAVSQPVLVVAEQGQVAGRTPLQLQVTSADGRISRTLDSSFFGPVP